MKSLTFLITLGFSAVTAPAAEKSAGQTTVIVVRGAAGGEEFAAGFASQSTAWEKAASAGSARVIIIGDKPPGDTPDRKRLEQTLAAEATEGPDALWLVLIGHGTFDGKEARFNLRGEDITATDLAGWLIPIHRPVALIDTSAASAPFLTKLSAPGRVIITATRTGSEQNFARLGEHLAASLTDPASDLDQDGDVSLLETFLAASAKAAEFYKTEGRLATEHALVDDNGDGMGTPAAWFRGLRAVKKPKDAAAVDGLRAHQWHLSRSATEQARPAEWRTRRDALEASIIRLREKKEKLPEDDYYRQLETLLLDLAKLYANTGD